MRIASLALAALIVPQTAAAFGNLDCISTQSCTAQGCTPTSDPFVLTFDWPASQATVGFAGTMTTLPLAAPVRTQNSADDQMQTIVEYGVPNDAASSLLRVEATGTGITAYFSVKTPDAATFIAQCAKQQAA